MKNLETGLRDRLNRLAYRVTIPFCYGCYHEAPKGRCEKCLSDDLMRLMPGIGCDWGTDWVIREIIRENLEPVRTERAFEECIRECYPETTKVGWLELDTVTTIKNADPVSWNMAVDEWVTNEDMEGRVASFDHSETYFWTSDIEKYLDENESEWEESA